MTFDSIKKKINVKTLMSQSEALVENTETLNSGIKRLFEVLSDKKKISPRKLTDADEKIKVTEQREREKKEKNKGGFPNLLPLLTGLGALGALGSAFAINPITATKYLTRTLLKGLFKFITRIGKIIKGIAETIGKLFKKIFTAIGDNVKRLKNFINEKFLKPIGEAFESAINSKWVKKLRLFFDNVVGSIKKFIGESVERFKVFASDIFNGVKTFISDFTERGIKAFRNILDDVGNAVKLLFERAKNGVLNLSQEIFEKYIDPIIKPIKENILNVVENIKNSIKYAVDTIDSILNNIQYKLNIGPIKLGDLLIRPVRDSLQTINTIVDNPIKIIKGAFDEVKAGVNFTIDLASTGARKVSDFAKQGVEFSKDLALSAIDSAKNLGSSIKSGFASGVNFIGEKGKQFGETLKSLSPSEQIGNALKGVKDSIGTITKNVSDSIAKPIMNSIGNAAKESPRAISNVLGGIGSGLGKLKPLLEGIKGVKNGVMGFLDKIPGIRGFKTGFRKATGKFDALFALAEIATAYGIRAAGGIDTPIGDLQGQAIGNAILTAASGFAGSALGSALGTAIGAPLGPGASITGAVGAILGGVLGEEVGKMISSNIAPTVPKENNVDPFLNPKKIFEVEEYNFNPFSGLFSSEELDPVGGFDAGPITRSIPINRNFESMEEYTDDYDAEVVVIKQTEIVHNTKVIEKSSSQSPIVIMNSGESLLNNFKTRSLTQLSYS